MKKKEGEVKKIRLSKETLRALESSGVRGVVGGVETTEIEMGTSAQTYDRPCLCTGSAWPC